MNRADSYSWTRFRLVKHVRSLCWTGRGGTMDGSGIRGRLRAIVPIAAAIVLAFGAERARAVVLDDDNRLTLTLSDNTPITLIGLAGAMSTEKTNQYYYLP